MRLLAMDFEATNKDPRRGCPCQLGIAVMDGETIIAQDEWLIKPPTHYKTGKPTKEVDAYALRVSGLSLETIEAEGLSSTASCDRLRKFVVGQQAESMPVLCYNFTFDAETYGQMLFDGGCYDRSIYEYMPYPEILSPRWICAYRLARKKLANDLIKFSLDDVADHLGLQRSGDTHSALEDAVLAAKVYHMLTKGVSS